jgi:hypothetical protein
VAEDAPIAAGLAEAARGRATIRRRRTTLAVAAASVAVLGVVAGTALLGNGGGSGRAADDPTPSDVVDPGLPPRVESWRDISVSVPADWGYGVLSTWCTNGATSPGTPLVERPEGMRAMILCTAPANGYGVMFSDGALFDAAEPAGKIWQYSPGDFAVYPDGAWLGYQRSNDAMAFVVAPNRADAELVLSSFERVTGVDSNGCSPKPTDDPPAAAPGTVRLCRYASDDWLEQSETLSGDDATKAMAALDAAPDRPALLCGVNGDQGFVQVRSADATALVRLQGCEGVFGWGGLQHDLTADVLYWVLSPGWAGAVDGGVPLPDKLRTR